MEISINTLDARRTAEVIERLPRKLTRGIADVLRDEAKLTAQDARKLLRRGRRRGRGARADLEDGAPPRSDTGQLARSIGFRAVRRDRLAYVVEVREFYGRILEAKGHPFVTIALDGRRASAERRLTNAIIAVINSAATER